MGNLARRYARTHGPFTPADFADRYALDVTIADATLGRLTADGALIEGDFRPGGIHREWTDAGVLRQLRRRSLARLRRETEPVDHAVFGRLTTAWQGIVRKRQGADALLDAIEQLQGTPLAASILESEILPARIEGYDPNDLDSLTAAGEVVWAGVEPIGDRDGRIALYLADQLPKRCPKRPPEGGRYGGAGSVRLQRTSILENLRSSITSARTVRRSSVRCTKPPAAGTRRKLCRRCGASSGGASSPTIHFMSCAHSRRHGRRDDVLAGTR